MWCGRESSEWFIASTLNPCYFNTAASGILLCWAALAVWQGRRSLQAQSRLGAQYAHLWSALEFKWPLKIQAASCVTLASIHGLALAFSIGAGGGVPYLVASETALLASWTSITVRKMHKNCHI